MPTYAFTCSGCGDLDQFFRIAEVPRAVPCPHCGSQAVRRFTAPAIGHEPNISTRLVEATRRSAHEPEVVARPPGRTGRRPMAPSPLQARLPRP